MYRDPLAGPIGERANLRSCVYETGSEIVMHFHIETRWTHCMTIAVYLRDNFRCNHDLLNANIPELLQINEPL